MRADGVTSRNHRNKKIEESEEMFSATFEQAAVGIAHVAPDGRWLRVNRKLCDIVGYSRDELMKLTFQEITHPEDLEADLAYVKQILAGEIHTYSMEKRYVRKDGSIVWINLTRSLVRKPSGEPKYFVAFIEDITERKQMEVSLQKNEQVLRLFVEHSPAAIAMFDNNMKYIVASRRFLMDYDLGDRNIIGRSHYEVFPEIPERWREIHRRCLAGATEKSEEDPFPRADGKMDWVRWEIRPWYETPGEIGGIILFSEVITERKRMEEALQIKQYMLSEAQRITHSGSWDVDLETGRIVWSDEMYRIYGVSPDTFEHTMDAFLKLIHPDDRAAMLKWIEVTFSGEKEKELDFRTVLSDGTVRFIRGAGEPFFDESGKPIRAIGTAQDITERRKTEEELGKYRKHLEDLVAERTQELEKSRTALQFLLEDITEAKNELEAANEKLKDLDRMKSIFLASMSHELRTPLNSIIGFTGIILMGMTGDISGEQRKQLTLVKNNAHHLLSLINDVLDISKIEAGKVELTMEEFALDEVMDTITASFSTQVLEKGVELLTDITSGIHMVSDKRRVRQIIMNLVSNAVKFTDHGNVRISARILKEDHVEVRVSDTGIGIRPDAMRLLFEPFQQVDMSLTKKYDGTGLGLYLCKKLSGLLGGTISVQSRFGKGSEFTVLLPVKRS